MISSQELIDLLTIDRKEKYHFVGQNYKTPGAESLGSGSWAITSCSLSNSS